MAVQFKKGDTSDPYQGNCQDDNGNVDITGYSSVKFFMENVETGNKKIDGKAMNVLDASKGLVEYEWDDADVDTAATYKAEIVVEFSNGEETFPSNNFKSIKIGEDINDS